MNKIIHTFLLTGQVKRASINRWIIPFDKICFLIPFCFILLFSVSSSVGQKQANVWHFGDGRCLDFSSGSPVNLPGSQISTFEGSASYCDRFGSFLFYTNGGGREPAFSFQDGGKIWNRNNAVMYDMQGIEGGGFSSAQSSVIFEAPGQDSVYYVFTMDEIEWDVGASPAIIASQPGGRGLSYFTVDMRMNGGLGGVVLANQQVYTPSYEGLCAIRHANGRDYWILINQDSSGIGVYGVTSSGVTLAGVYTAAGQNAFTPIKASPDGNRVVTNFVVNGLQASTLLSFNNATGQLSNPIPFTDELQSGEFSPNSRYLYGLSFDPVSTQIVLKQYDLQAANFNASPLLMYTLPAGQLSITLQLTPNGRILFPVSDFGASSVYLHQISCPNTSTPGLLLNLFTYSSQNGFYSLPNYPAWLFEDYDPVYVQLGPDTLELCGSTQSYLLNAQNPSATYLWSTGATTQTITVNTPGTYTVTVTGPCGTGSDEVVVVNCNATVPLPNCDTSGNWYFFGNYDGGKLNIGVDENVPNMKIGICTYEPVEVTFSGPFVNNITDVYYAGFNSSVGNNHCGFPITTTSVNGVNPALVTIDVAPPVNIISPPNPANSLNAPNGWNFGVICVFSCDTSTSQGGCNTIDQALDVFQTRFGGSLRGLKVQYCCWSDSLPYRLSSVTGSCCSSTSGIASVSYPPGPFCAGSGGLLSPTLLGDSSGTFYANQPGLVIDPATGVIDLSLSTPGIYEVVYSIFTNCTPYLYRNTLSLTSGFINPPITAFACSTYTAPWGTVYTQSGIYNDTLTSANGCDSILVLDLTVIGPSIAPPITANACSSYTAPWGTVYNQSGTYSDTLATVNGCDSIVSVNLTITGAILTPPITASACSSYTAPWGTVYTQSGTFSDTLTTAIGCDSIVTVNLTITGTVIAPPFTASACNSYTAPWGTVYTQSGTYSDTLTTANGCDSIVSVNLTVNSSVITPPITADACDTYTSPWGSVYTQSGSYTDTLNAANGCDSIVSVNLTIYTDPTVQVNASGSTIIGLGDSLQLNASGAANYQWSPSTGLSCSNCPSPVATPSGSITYIVTGTDGNGCSSTASISITVDIRCNELFIPDIFSPDGIGPLENEQVCVFSNCIRSMNLAIYDRWGQLLFSTEDPLQCWNGMKDGKEVPAGVYVYRLFVRQIDGKEISKSGNITLIR